MPSDYRLRPAPSFARPTVRGTLSAMTVGERVWNVVAWAAIVACAVGTGVALGLVF